MQWGSSNFSLLEFAGINNSWIIHCCAFDLLTFTKYIGVGGRGDNQTGILNDTRHSWLDLCFVYFSNLYLKCIYKVLHTFDVNICLDHFSWLEFIRAGPLYTLLWLRLVVPCCFVFFFAPWKYTNTVFNAVRRKCETAGSFSCVITRFSLTLNGNCAFHIYSVSTKALGYAVNDLSDNDSAAMFMKEWHCIGKNWIYIAHNLFFVVVAHS